MYRSAQSAVYCLLLLSSTALLASATADDYEPCKKKALLTLQQCLAGQHGNSLTIRQCWPDSEQHFSRCVSDVTASYSTSPQQRREMAEQIKAQEAAKTRLDADRNQ